ncbi:DUF2625 family protein [Streptomyces poriferorum]|uniref:DUF2625 family protein n=1 Tax=Streptomyces poriferorum TaxID=2798799 RepID=A0ABY9IGF1_9ACTN|nr:MULTISPECIES: DUF2625 family protein [unclassified Streptomyces]MDP5315941.1 DUF2625 family protein [Streptomyces sp. Alt4]WLQ54288.1 DUF2625 family protein [Streptomyces sp. Alt2]
MRRELTDVDDPAWPVLQEGFANSSVPVEVLPGDPGQGRACLLQLQVGARSALGALVLHSGGLVVDHGWVRVLAGAPSGAAGLPGLARVNRYDGLRWPGRQRESQSLDLSRGIAVYPFLWSKEAQADPAATTRTPVPLTELLALSGEFCRQMGLGDPGFLGSLPSEGRA